MATQIYWSEGTPEIADSTMRWDAGNPYAYFYIAAGAQTYTSVVSLNSLLQRTGITKSVSLGAMLNKSGLTHQALVDALLKKQGVNVTVALDSVLAVSHAINTALNALLQKKRISTAQMNAILIGAQSVLVSLNALLQKQGVTHDVHLDALLREVPGPVDFD